ncbi:hypothetical protein Q7P35_009901 [Cladosporium inversicolor]
MQHSRINLRTGWSMKESDSKEWLPVSKVPSNVHVDLLANNIIPDPFLNTNELSTQEFASKSWLYRLELPLPPNPTSTTTTSNPPKFTDLVFSGLDTFATVTLNNKIILQSSNMHLTHRINITNHIHRGDAPNILEIHFDSALQRGRELVKAHPEHQHFARQTEESRIPVRKAQYHWGWDWGPILMTAGPWRPVWVEMYEARVEDVWVRVVGVPEGTEVLLCLSSEGRVVFEAVARTDGEGLAETEFSVEDVKLWHPLGYGPQHRYELSAKLHHNNVVAASSSKLIGFRTCELIQEPDNNGKSFYFRVNGVDIFCGGSCWIPGDSFLSEIKPERYHAWIKLLAASNQVMIRVWGGGIYEDDAFFDACDELGILVWHDFAFACGNYPVYASFLESVEREVRQNLRRTRSHPSLVIWAGNNEDYQVLERYKLEYDPESRDPEAWLKTTFPARYTYECFLPKLLEEEAPGTIYHPGSPWGDHRHSADPTVGDIHQWDIWHGAMNKYQSAADLSGRFVSEFGMEAYPHLETTQRMIQPVSQQHPGSAMMDFRNKAGDHERRLLTYVAENLSLQSNDLATFTHLTQIVQSETMRYAYKSWRRMWSEAGQRKCGGALVWQLNDCWPTISWAVVDYYMIKKPAFYAIARALRPLDVGIARGDPDWTNGHNDPTLADPADFEVWVSSSRLESVEAQLVISFISIATGRPVHEPIPRKVEARPNATTECIHGHQAAEIDKDDFGWAKDDPYIIHAALEVNGKIEATDTAWPQPLKYLDFSNRGVKVEYSSCKTEARVSAKLPVKGFVFSETQGLELSDNGFDIMPGEEHIVSIGGPSTVKTALEWTYVGAERVEEVTSRPKL